MCGRQFGCNVAHTQTLNTIGISSPWPSATATITDSPDRVNSLEPKTMATSYVKNSIRITAPTCHRKELKGAITYGQQ
jgi:hypothetical protein